MCRELSERTWNRVSLVACDPTRWSRITCCSATAFPNSETIRRPLEKPTRYYGRIREAYLVPAIYFGIHLRGAFFVSVRFRIDTFGFSDRKQRQFSMSRTKNLECDRRGRRRLTRRAIRIRKAENTREFKETHERPKSESRRSGWAPELVDLRHGRGTRNRQKAQQRGQLGEHLPRSRSQSITRV